MYLLETIHIGSDRNLIDCRFPIQTVIRPQTKEHHDYRGYAGEIAGGVFKKGDDVMVLPSGFTSKIASIDTYDGEVEEAFAPISVTMRLEDELDLSRGGMIVRENNMPEVSQDVELMLCWLNDKPLVQNGKYSIKHTTKFARCIVKEIKYKININNLHRVEDDKEGGGAEAALGPVQPLIDRGTGNQFGGVPVDEAVFLAEIAQDSIGFMDRDVIVHERGDLMVRIHEEIVGRHMFAGVERDVTGFAWNAGFFEQSENPATVLRYRMAVQDGHIMVSNRASG